MRDDIRKLAPPRDRAQHPGLLLNRYLAAHDKDGQDRRVLMDAVCRAGQDPSLRKMYGLAYKRWVGGFREIQSNAIVTTPPFTRLIVGLGNKGVVEAGLRLHHTYGLPFIPGSALKGIASHYCAEVWGVNDPQYALPPECFDAEMDTNFHRLLFGATDDGGVLRFEDAWLTPESPGIQKDIMTPHHQEWQTDKEIAPTDFDSPIPVPFLSVAGSFHLAVTWQGPWSEHAAAWTQRVMALLLAALKDWGVGGKTSSGYGRLVRFEGRPDAAPAWTPGPRIATGPQPKRDSGTPTQVTIVGPREKGGFDVQEEGRPMGTLTLGTQPSDVNTEAGSVVDVLVANDDPRKPQYRWPNPTQQSRGGSSPGKPGKR